MIENNLLQEIFQVLLATISSLGFAFALNVKKRNIIWGSIGGGLSWIVSLCITNLSFSIFSSSLISATFAYIYSAILAKTKKSPINVFFAPTIIPLIPGSKLYYSVSALIEENSENFVLFGKEMLMTSFGLVIGFLLSSIFWNTITKYSKKIY